MTTAVATTDQVLKLISFSADTVTFTVQGSRTPMSRKIGKDGTFSRKGYNYQLVDGVINFIGVGEGVETGQVLANAISAYPLKELQSEFDINLRFEFMRKFVNMVLKGELVSTIITGDGGLGKSHTVLEELKSFGLIEDVDFTIIKGYATPKALYATLYEWNDKIVVFDDCDSVLKDPTAINILKSALDSYETRRISWLTKGFIDDGLPLSFEFTGQVIFISNMPSSKMDGAVKSRTVFVDLSMSMEDKIERMRFILPDILIKIPLAIRELGLEYLIANANVAKEFNMRTLQKTIKIIHSYGVTNLKWKDAVKYMLTSD
jgi:hypothetical protein